MKWKIALPAAYLALALYVWVDFMRTNPDGLANLGLMLMVFPVTIVGLILGWALGEGSFMLLPDGLDYYAGHAVFYAPSVLLIAAGFWYIGNRIDRRRR